MVEVDNDPRVEDDAKGRGPDAVLSRAKRRFKNSQDWEGTSHNRGYEDMKFLFGDPDNGWQWDESMRRRRLFDKRPCLTVNKTHVHWLSVVNDGKAQKPSISVHPVSNGATYEAAQAFEDVIRHIEYTSNAQAAYDKALEWQVGCGLGYWRVETRYVDDNAFDQEIFISEVDDPLSIYLDPDIKQQDGSDARYAFIFKEFPTPEFKMKYPDAGEVGENTNMGETGMTWLRPGYIRVAEYFEVIEKKDTMYGFTAPDGSVRTLLKSQMSEQEKADIERAKEMGHEIQERKSTQKQVWWYLIAGDKIIDRRRWPGKYIPLVRCIAEEIVLDGKLDRKGLVRYLKDPQKQYNYNASAQVEFVALQGKTPWLASMGAVAGYEQYYKTANHINHAWLPYNDVDEDGNKHERPQRADPPKFSEGYQLGMEAAAEQMKMATGQNDALMGAPSNETSGVAIDKRARQGERATYHFVDGQAKAIRFTGKILIDLIPKVMDAKRVMRIRGESGDMREIHIDPTNPQGIQKNENEHGTLMILNPSVGLFDVVADIGPNYETRRQEAFNAFREIAAKNPELMQVAGDLMFKAADFPMADELAKRLENWISPAIRGVGPSPQEQQLQQQLQQAVQKIQELSAQLKNKQGEIAVRQEHNKLTFLDHLGRRVDVDHQKEIDAYNAITNRLKATGTLSPEVSVDTVHSVFKQPLDGVERIDVPQNPGYSQVQSGLQ